MAKSAIFRQFPRLVPVPTGVEPVPLLQNQNGTGTTHQNRIGTSIDPSGTDTTTSYNPDFWYSYIVKPKFVLRQYRNPNKLLMWVQIRIKLSEKRTVPRRLGEASSIMENVMPLL